MTLTGATALAEPSADFDYGGTGRYDQPWHGFAPAWLTLRDANPADVGLDPAPIAGALDAVTGWTKPGPAGHPMFSGAVTLMVHDGAVVADQPAGYAVRYSDGAGTELPPDQRVPMARDTIFDMASVSKLFTSIAVMQQVEAGRVDINAPVARYLPEFAANGKGSITVVQLLTHTSGLLPDPVPSLWQGYPDIPSRVRAIMETTPANPPGTTYSYSDINLMTLGLLVAKVSGSTLDGLVREGITAPLDMSDTGYNPPASKLDRIAATEFQTSPPRGMVRGQVHDENAWSLGGVAGHAGVFSTAHDMAVLGQTILNGGTYRGHRILREDTVRQMLTNFNAKFPGDSHGLGFELDQRWYMAGLNSANSAGHTGYTGTTLVLDPESRSIAILLTNRVHPSRNWGTINPARRAVADGLARSMAVRPRQGSTEWTATAAADQAVTLSTKQLPVRGKTMRVSFDAFVDVDAEDGDQLALQSSADGVAWQPVPVLAEGVGAPQGPQPALAAYGHRRWWRVSAELPATGFLRWQFTKAGIYFGRGVYLDGIRVQDSRGVLLDAERDPGALTAQGWSVVSR
ncbi:serine hydrolase domain-containing protein [Solihabitans fulvus]|nr:serine hydrolase domain-containing protein [Solihabitans fulvus]